MSCFFNCKTQAYSKMGRYKLHRVIKDFATGINCLEVLPRGVLACRGEFPYVGNWTQGILILHKGPDGLSLYNLNSLKKIKTPLHDIALYSKVTALAWLTISTKKDCGDTLSFST